MEQTLQHNKNKIFVITGKVQSGKTTFLNNLVHEIKDKGFEVAGFLCFGQFSKGKRSDFTLIDINNYTKVLLATVENHSSWPRYGRFFFNPLAIEAGEKILGKAIEHGRGIVILDEVGPMELQGGGWAPMVDLLAKEKILVQIWVVREQILEEVRQRWEIPAGNVIRVGKEMKEEIIKKIIAHVRNDESSKAE